MLFSTFFIPQLLLVFEDVTFCDILFCSTVSFFKMCQVFVICCCFDPSGPPYAYFITLFYVLIILCLCSVLKAS